MASAEYAPAILRTRPVATGHWRAFLAVAKHLNFRAAADELALTQSAVSRQIQALEEEIGVALFLRARARDDQPGGPPAEAAEPVGAPVPG